MQLPVEFLDNFDLLVQHGNYEETKQLIENNLKQCNTIKNQLKRGIHNVWDIDLEKLVKYLLIKSSEAELMAEIGNYEQADNLSKIFIKLIGHFIDIGTQSPIFRESNDMIDYLLFAKAEFMRVQIDVNRKLGNLMVIDQLLEEIDTIFGNLKISNKNPRIIKSKAYNRNFKAIQMWNYGKPEEAKLLFKQCIKDFEYLGASADVAMIHNNLGLIYLMQGDFHKAIFNFKITLNYFEDKHNPTIVATLLNNMGEAYREIGDIPEALSYHERTLKLRNDIGLDVDIGQSYLFLGILYKSQGKLDLAVTHFFKSLEIYKIINHKLNISRLLYNIGEVYLDRGEYDKAENYYIECISYLEESQNPVVLADSYHSLGLINREKGNYEKALSEFHKSSKLRQNIGNQPIVAITKCEMAECFVIQGNMRSASKLLTEIESIQVNYPEHKTLNIAYLLIQGIFYQYSIRMRDKVKAEHIFRKILNEPFIPYLHEVRTSKQLIKLLLEELQNYGEEEVLIELVSYLDKLESLAIQQSLLVVQIEIYLIRHQLQLLLGETLPGENYLDKADEIVKRLKIPLLTQKFENEKRNSKHFKEMWHSIDQMTVSEKLKISRLSTSLNHSRNLLHLYQQEDWQPLLVMVFSEGGTISFSHFFEAVNDQRFSKINPHLIASFISALNSFGKDTFETSNILETLNYGDHKLISRKLNNFTISLLYEGMNLDIFEKLVEIEKFLINSGIFTEIENNPFQEVNIKEDQKETIESIFN